MCTRKIQHRLIETDLFQDDGSACSLFTFDVDANGILHVSAKDKTTGKEQKIRIEARSGLEEDEIKRMIRDAEDHKEEDRKRKEEIEIRNEADALVFRAEKSLSEYKDKLSATIVKDIQDRQSDLACLICWLNRHIVGDPTDQTAAGCISIVQHLMTFFAIQQFSAMLQLGGWEMMLHHWAAFLSVITAAISHQARVPALESG